MNKSSKTHTDAKQSNQPKYYLIVEQLVSVYPSNCPPDDMIISNSNSNSNSGTGVIVQWQGSPHADMIADGRLYI